MISELPGIFLCAFLLRWIVIFHLIVAVSCNKDKWTHGLPEAITLYLVDMTRFPILAFESRLKHSPLLTLFPLSSVFSGQNISMHNTVGGAMVGPGAHQLGSTRMPNHDTSVVIQQAMPSPQSSSVITQAPSTNRQIG